MEQYNFYKITENYEVKARYAYLADGTKLYALADTVVESFSSLVGGTTYDTVSNGFEYLGSLVYKVNNNTRTLESTAFGGGRINKTSTGYEVNYFITDHLGSTRVITDNAGNIKEQNDYYPFGMRHTNANLMISANRWGFNGKEKQITQSLNYLDYGARMYDDFLGRWFTQDLLQEKYYSLSSYVFSANNPINFIDPNGMEWLNSKDIEYANSIITEITKQIATKQQTINNLKEKIKNNTELGKDVSEDQKTISNLTTDISNLNSSKTEITQMGDTKEQKFTFKKIDGNEGGTTKGADGVITMKISGFGNTANGIHESVHGYDLWKTGFNTHSNWNDREIKAYSRQFSFDKSSIPNSYWGKANNLHDITTNWVYGIYNNNGGKRDYLYVHYFLQGLKRTNTEIEEWIDGLRGK